MWMEVEMEEPASVAGRREGGRSLDPLQLLLETREERRVTAKRPHASPELLGHRRAVDPIQHETICGDVEDARHRIAMPSRVAHHHGLSIRIAARLEAAQDAAVAEIEDLRGAS